MQPFDTPDLDIEPHEAFELVICELHSHAATGRKNFVVRVPQDMVIYLFTGILRRPIYPKWCWKESCLNWDCMGSRMQMAAYFGVT